MKKYSAWIAAFAVAFVVVDVLLRVTGAGNHSSSDEEQPIEPANQANQSKEEASYDDTTGQPGPQGGLSKPEKTDNAIPVNQDGGNNEGFTNESATGNTD